MAYTQKINSRDIDTPGSFRENQEKKYRKGYRRVISEESGSTDQGRKTVIATYRPSRNLSKVVETDIEYKTPTSPRKKLTIKEKTKRHNDGSVKSYKYIVKQNGSIVPEVTKPKVKYKRGEKPFGRKF